jgi:predicted AlkP superfamily pyrophosphatase or phosphodiesterase
MSIHRMYSRSARAGLALGFMTLTIGHPAGLTLAAPVQAQAPATNRHVIVISIDGFAAYALADQAVPLPHLRALAKAGVMAEAMLPINPTVTWPNHTAMVTGVGPDRHGVLYNGLPVRRTTGTGAPIKIEAHVDKPQLVLAPTVYDLAHQHGLTTAEIDWVAIEHAPTITWSFPEYDEPQLPVAREMVAAGVVTEADLQRFGKAPITFRDEIWTRAAEHLIKTHKPNLLLFHLLTTDSVQHQYGARTLAAQTALALADARVGRLVDACRAAGILETTTFVIVSDHGFKTYKQRIRPNIVLKQHALGNAAWAVAEGGTAMVYLTGDAANAGAGAGAASKAGSATTAASAAGTAAAADRAKTIEAVKQAFVGVDGIAQVLTPEDFATYGYPSPEKTERMSSLVLAARDGFAFDDSVEGDIVSPVAAGASLGAHGYLNTDDDMRAIFIASGAGVRRGATLGVIHNVDVAPTIARWLGLDMTNIVGHALTEIIDATPGSRAIH